MNASNAFFMFSIAMYATGHWIAGTVALIVAVMEAN